MRFRYLPLMQAESSDLADLLASLSESDWDAPTLCDGWRVREVVSHMAAGHTSSLTDYAVQLARSGFSTDRTSDVLARRFAAEHDSAGILAEFRRGTAGRPQGPTALVPRSELFTDHLVHHQDIRRSLGLPRAIEAERLRAALHALPRLAARVGSRARLRSLRVVADDVPWSHGDGLLVQGPAEAIVMALCGRAVAAQELRGDGAVLLRRRLAAEALARQGTGADASVPPVPGAPATPTMPATPAMPATPGGVRTGEGR